MEKSVLVTSTLILLTSNIRGHTNTDQHIHTYYGNKMEKAQVKGQLSVISPGSITEILYKIGEQKQGRLKVKFAIAYILWPNYVNYNNVACKMFCHFTAHSKCQLLMDELTKVNYYSLLLGESTNYI